MMGPHSANRNVQFTLKSGAQSLRILLFRVNTEERPSAESKKEYRGTETSNVAEENRLVLMRLENQVQEQLAYAD